MVLEGLVANVLNRVLGMYVHNFDPKQLSVGIFNHEAKLRGLLLRKEALDQLRLPLNVVQGYVGELTLSIPFTNLRGEPVKATIQDLYILAAPREDADINVEEEDARAHKLKMEKLESAELLKERNTEGMSKEDQQKQQSFVASLTTAVVDNLQVFVKNVHIRYEDTISHPGHPFAAGLTLSDFSAESTDENWKPGFILNPANSTHKLAKLGALAVYWDTDATLIGPGKAAGEPPSLEDMLSKFKEMAAEGATAKHQYILKPVSGMAGLELDKTGKNDVPKMKARVFFDELGFVLDEDQYRDSLMLVDLFHYFIRHQETKKFQPKMSVSEDPKAWFRFAGKAVQDRIHDREKQWSWAYMAERRDRRKRYIELFKKKKKEEKLSPQETEELDRIEKASDYEALRFWRSLARNQLRKENVGVKKAPQKQTWGQWVFGGGQQEEQPETMTEEQRNELYAAIDFDEQKAISDAVDLPKETVKMQARISLQTGSFALKRDPHGKGIEILKLQFDGFNASFLQRPTSSLTSLSLQGLQLYDDTTEGNLFPLTIRVKDQAIHELKPKEGDNHEELTRNALQMNDDDASHLHEHAFFALRFEQHPLDNNADSAVNLKLRAMEVVYNPRFIVEVAKFFKPPSRHMESIGALMDSAGEAVEGLRKQTRAGLEFALEEHKTIDAHLDLQAPLIIVPDSVTQESSNCLILDAGHISVNSDLVDKKTIHDIQSKQSQKYTEKDYEHLEELMYDKFRLQLESTQLLIGPSISATRAQLEGKIEGQNLHLIDRINMDFLVEMCILTKGTDLTRFRITGKLPVLHASLSDSKYKNLMRLIEVAIPKFETDQTQQQPAAIAPTAVNDSAAANKIKNELRRPRSKSFQFSAQEYELLADEDEYDKQQSFHDASQSHKPADASANRRNFEFKFVVEKLQGSLFKSNDDSSKADSLLAELVANNFSLNFYQRQHDMVAEVGLARLALEDHVEENPSPEFRNIVSSDDHGSGDTKDLLHLKFVKVQKDSPEFMSVYEGFGTNLDVSVSTINLIVTRKTLLTLLDFIMVTFTSSDAPKQEPKKLEDSGQKQDLEPTDPSGDADKIRIKVGLQKIAVVLNNDGIRLATLSLNTATVGLTLMGKAMRVSAKLGDLSLIDDVNQGASRDSPTRQLLTIQGKELADFAYETFDPNSDAYPGYDSSVKLTSGSLKVNFLTEPFRKIMEFGVKFGKMQAIFNAARQAAANQAGQIQERATKMHFDVLISTPIIVFPRAVFGSGKLERDSLTAYLGEIYFQNKFVPIDDKKDSDTANVLSAGIRNVKLESLLHYGEGKSETLELIDKVDLGFNVTKVDHKPGYKRPDWEIDGSLSDLNLRLSAPQMQMVMGLVRTIPQAFSGQSDDEMEKDVQERLPASKTESAKEVASSRKDDSEKTPAKPMEQAPELGSSSETWTTMDFAFNIGAVGLELINASNEGPVGDVKTASLSKFSLNQTKVKARMTSDGAMESELQIQSFIIQDTRERETNKFRKIMSLVNSDVSQQFMASFSMSGGDDKNMLVMFTIDSPKIIVALEYIFAIQAFVNAGLAVDESSALPTIEEESEESEDDALTRASTVADSSSPVDPADASTQPKSSLSFRVNLVDAQVLLIANAAMANSEAIVLSMKQAVVTQQHALTLQVEKVGMFLCRMDRPKQDHLRILDDFSITSSHDIRSQSPDSSMINIHVDIEPLVLRLSLRDIQLAMQIATKAMSLTASKDDSSRSGEPEKVKQLKGGSTIRSGRRSSTAAAQSAKSIRTKTTRPQQQQAIEEQPSGSIILKREEASVHVAGIRVVLIGDVHELPILDWSVKAFDIDARDWSGAMTAETSMDTFFNIYNFSKSSWEPLVEPWTLGFHMSKSPHPPNKLSVELYSRKTMEVTMTTATIALMYKTMQLLTSGEDVLSKARTTKEPYRIRNHTGFTMSLWASTDKGDEGSAARLEDGNEIPWRFEDPATTRESLSPEASTGVVGMKLEGSGFDSVNKISVNREGEKIYTLSPRHDGVLHRFVVEVSVGTDNVKYITFRSPLSVENNTQIPIELGVYSPEHGNLVKIDKIKPGETRSSPVGAAFMHSLLIRPDEGFGYAWSEEKLFWKDLVRKPTSTITCKGQQPDSAPPFYFQSHAVFDGNNPLTRVYPCMRIRLTPPMELHNLLPYDFTYRIYDKNTKRDWTNFLRKGGISPGHVVNVNHLLLLSVELQDTPFKQSDYAIINSSERDFKRESKVLVKDDRDLPLKLKLHYYNIPDTGGAFKVSVYSPYVILNKTGLELDIRSKAFMSQAKASAGQKAILGASSDPDRPEKARPFMFSFATDDQKNRALIKIGDSEWGKPLSFDAIGSDYSTAVPSPAGKSEMQVGVTVSQGEGKYNLTKVVTFTPRFVLRNGLREEIMIREPGSSEVANMPAGAMHPLRYMRQQQSQQLCFCFPGVDNQWSAPFHISNVGRVHVKLAKAKHRQQLIKVEILLEDATLFLHLTETDQWPYAIRNESDTEFRFHQANPNVEEDEDERTTNFRPINYRIPPRSIMPYAWDFPASRNKDLVLECQGKMRHVKLAEIGPQKPMVVPAQQGRPKTFGVDIVADGPKQELVISNFKPSLSLFRQKTGGSSRSVTDINFEVKDLSSDVTMSVNLRLAGFGLSLVNRQFRELIYLTLRDVELKYNDSRLYQTLDWTTKWIQIDNQLYGGIFPILLYPSVVPKTGEQLEAHPIFHTAITRVKDDSYGVLYIKYATLLLQQMTLEIDEDFIFALLDFVKIPGVTFTEGEVEGKLCDEELDIPEPHKEESGQDVYFELLHLQPIQIDLSFVRTERINAEDTMAINSPLMFAVNVLTMSLGNVNDAPLRYNALMLENARIAPNVLMGNVQAHFVQESIRQVHVVLGSADFLGNPVGLFNNVSSGVADIFYEPYQGLVATDRPQDLGLGIAKGASSFVKKSVFGLSDSMAKVTGSMAKGLAAASLDKEYQDQRRMSKSRNRPKHALYGITSGGNAFANTLASGIGGLARAPLEGAEKEGFGGFVKGVGKGVLGFATKAALAPIDLTSSVFEGVRNTTTLFDSTELDRVRPTRFIAADQVVRPYSQREALGQFWLKTAENGRFFNEHYIAHLDLKSGGQEMLVMLTYDRIMLIRTQRLALEWEVPLKDIKRISKERTGMNFTLKNSQGPFLPVSEESQRNFLYKQIEVAVIAYNEKWQAKG